MEYNKVKSVAKALSSKGTNQSQLVLKTMKTISDLVGSTLGPGGQPVLIERYEHDLPPMVTKDGVTVFRSIGFKDSMQHVCMEAARDSAIRTATEAGDGTTTCAVIGEAVVRAIDQFCAQNSQARPQKVVRRLEQAFREVVEPTVKSLAKAYQADLGSPLGIELLTSVAKVSTNGDSALAAAVMECFEITGDEGNVTIIEQSGPSGYEVTRVDGYPIPIGYEDCCAKFYTKFINDTGRQMSLMENPVFMLYHGTLNDIQAAYGLLAKVGDKYEELIQGTQNDYKHYNVVLAAIGFSEQVLATFAAGWQIPNSIKIFPLTVPKSPLSNFQVQFLDDIAAITGATVFDPINRPLDTGTLEDLGPGVTAFEASRYRSSIIGRAQGQEAEDRQLERISVVEAQLENPESELDERLLRDRLAKLTGGIAKLRVIGASNGELKEKRDRAEDAVCAVRGAIKKGCLPGGGYALLRICHELVAVYGTDPVINQVLIPALQEPVHRLLTNCGMTEAEIRDTLSPIISGIQAGEAPLVFDAMESRHGDPVELGILDSTPAVLEAIRNSISIGGLLGTLGGIVVFVRDNELERQEARDTADFIRNANLPNPADERA